LNLHNGHKVVRIDDEETLKKENISINDYIKDFDIYTQEITNIKDKIENEIKKINISYENVDKEVTKSFKLKHEQLIKEEKDMKDKLQTEVTKIKSKLEEYLSLINDLIRNNEKINKGIKKLNEDDENKNIQMLKNLTYISKINKNKKGMNKISQILMKSLKLNYIEDNIKYEKYYFNGFPFPKDIQIDEIKINSFKISWKIDDLNILGLDKNKIKYKVEIRKENEEFKQVCESNDLNFNIDKLNPDTNYEIRICTVYNNINSKWSEIKKVKTNQFDSIILNETKRCDEFLNKIYEWTGGKNMELLYRGTRDGMSADSFHNKCDNKGPTINLFKHEKGYIFGGYSSINWQSIGGYKSAPDSSLFTLTNIYELSPTKFPNSNSNYSIYCNSKYGPTFGNGHDICIEFPSSYKAYFPYSYKDVLGKGMSIFTGDNNNNDSYQYFNLKEIEVFKLIK